ncbi:MAG: hypothetical protein ABIO04_10140 [Ferruginibacter sp.]
MKTILFACMLIAAGSNISGQSISRNVIASAGGTFTSTAGQINYNIGETIITSLTAGSIMITQGFEQPAESRLNLKLYLQGYYVDGGIMQPVLLNQGLAALATETDTITVELHHAENFALLDSKKAVLLTDGTVSVNFNQPEGTYYIAVKHRNTIQTWSANAVMCTANTALYNFSNASTQAMGDNQVLLQSGVWGMYTGDLNQDDFIDGNDFPVLDNDAFNGVAFEYVATDLNGDGFVDSNDFPVFDNNSYNGVAAVHP